MLTNSHLRGACLRAAVVKAVTVAVLTLHTSPTLASLLCPNACSGHGACDTSVGTCSCFTDFTGYDCSQRSCATGAPWVAVATSTDEARDVEVECSNAGTCNRATGVCKCDALFESAACDVMACPVHDGEVCGGRGNCMTMSEFATSLKSSYTLWDATMVTGCVCDAPYFGYACSLTACTEGDDPSSDLEDQECNARGHCDYDTGLCTCEDGYSSSGTQNDCSVKNNATLTDACPESPSTHRRSHGGMDLTGTCSGRGLCDGADVAKSTLCQCYDDWQGYVCDERSCPTGRAWFDAVSAADTAHADTECSAMGTCDRRTGECHCRVGFEGPACERMACPRDEDGRVCGGAGRCRTMRQLAATAISATGEADPVTYGTIPGRSATDTWDADKLQGCSCFGSVFERPYAQANGPTTAWTGYRCTERTCPTGDPVYNIVLLGSAPEVQLVNCSSTADAGNTTFTLSFRGHTTSSISGNATAADVQSALEALWTVGSVDVEFLGSETEACAVAETGIQVTFRSEFGEISMLTVACEGDCAAASVTVTRNGTKLDQPCSGSGVCDTKVGECSCFDGFASSDGFAGSGLRMDCGFNLA